jgi:hypothetical protein
MAVSYLTIAAGTGRGNRLSSWSAHAVEKYTGLHSGRATSAISGLIEACHIVFAENSTKARPRYELPLCYEDNAPRDETIWLPNTLVTGTASGERSPVGRLRSRQDVSALRLLINLYSAQNLSMNGGISREVLHQEYERKRYGERGRLVVWGFHAREEQAFPHPSTDFFWQWQTDENPIWDALGCCGAKG